MALVTAPPRPIVFDLAEGERRFMKLQLHPVITRPCILLNRIAVNPSIDKTTPNMQADRNFSSKGGHHRASAEAAIMATAGHMTESCEIIKSS
ncbi:hypothetical protein EV130_103304 [Rhizobium azibense]|uniref:Uncharacterized protein n=1 Tax=Rhizobium azibense TaxID=1136135 RepID=A0A4R3R284_9HYPH|nr:hypothetical protein EV130_103304 [Rhizobium azibense]